MHQHKFIFFFLFLIVIFSACNPSKHLSDQEYMLTKNTVKVVDNRSLEFDDLYYTVRPITNKKFLDVFPIKTSIYVNHLPKTDSAGNVIKDTKFNRWMRSLGEEPVLLDTNMIQYSMDQIEIAMKNLGHFNAEVWYDTKYKAPNRWHPRRHKAEVTYFVKANEGFYVRDINYVIDIFEYKRIILKDTLNSLLNVGDKYNAETLLAERERIVNNIRNNGYYYVSNDIVSFEIDTLNRNDNPANNQKKMLSINILINFSKIKDPDIQNQYAYKFYFNNVYIYPNYDPLYDYNKNSSIRHIYHRKKDSTLYYIVSMNEELFPKEKKNKSIPDIRSRILADNILTKAETPYSQQLIMRSRKKLSDLKNFNFIDIQIAENKAKRDTINRIGYLNTTYRLTRNKLHSLAVEVEARSDKGSLSLTYSNRNLFRSAEFFNINIYGSAGIRSKVNSNQKFILYSESLEAGGEISMDFRRLLFFRKTQKIEAVSYGTSLRVGAHYQYNSLYERSLYNLALVYNLAHDYRLTHTITPIDLSIINIASTGERFQEVMSLYSKDFQEKYKDNFLLSFKYGLSYIHPTKNKRNSFTIRLKLESSGMFLTGMNALLNAPKNEKGQYTIFGGDYGNFETAEIDLRYGRTINKNNSIATRFNFGIGVPLLNATTLLFEKSFFLGGANSMRAWEYRTLGPGSYYKTENIAHDIRTGDIKLELNIEYRGTIYKFIKYGIFVDAGNIWLTHKDEKMPNAEFQFNRFYKEIGLGAGVGVRFDFSFFIIRIDAALPIYEPSRAIDNRWLKVVDEGGRKSLNKSLNIIFGIGHAF